MPPDFLSTWNSIVVLKGFNGVNLIWNSSLSYVLLSLFFVIFILIDFSTIILSESYIPLSSYEKVSFKASKFSAIPYN